MINHARVARHQANETDGPTFHTTAATIIMLLLVSLLVYNWLLHKIDHLYLTRDFILTLTGVSVFWLIKHYATRLYFNVRNLEESYQKLLFYLRIYRTLSSYVLLAVVTIVALTVNLARQTSLIILIAYGGIQIAVHLSVWYRCRKTISKMLITFILYLCALEILPYLLLYKYFMQ